MTDPKADEGTASSTINVPIDHVLDGTSNVSAADPGTEQRTGSATNNDVAETEHNPRMDHGRYGPFTTLPPGAHRVPGIDGWGYSTPANRRPSPPESLNENVDVAATAYTVEDTPEPVPAEVIDTCLGVDKKRLTALGMGSILLLSIILAIVLGILLPETNNGAAESQNNVCGPLCGNGNVPNPDQLIMGLSCGEWDSNSKSLPLSSSSESGGDCASTYSAAAFGCGCANVEVLSTKCGMLCEDGSDLPIPDMLVKDINNVELTCADWELKAKFDSDPRECPNYNTIGMMCGCKSNESHPDACGPLCTENSFASEDYEVYGTSCKNWDLMSRSLPKWYHNEAEEECSEYYRDIAYACGCPEVKSPHDSCNSLCQDRRKCGGICQDGSPVPDDKLVVRTTTCHSWEYHARIDFYDAVCPYYDMIGYECGCNNIPPEDAFGPLCGPGTSVPDPTLVVQGLTCSEWDSMSKYLPSDYGYTPESYLLPSFACGCHGVSPPLNSCGGLCADGSPLPDPSLVVGNKRCGDWELLSIFATDPLDCSRYRLLGPDCGCKDPVPDSDNACFTVESLMNKTFSHAVGYQHYSITFGKGGLFGVMQSNIAMNIIGRFNGFVISENGTEAIFGDGAPCGMFGIRRGSVQIVEDPSVFEPEISHVTEPVVCVYLAELRVPMSCSVAT